MLTDKDAPPAQQKPDFDSLLADLFGLNIRGAKTLRDLLIRPKQVFNSARVLDWRSQYTPTMRLAFSILTVFSLLSFFWTSENSILYQSLLAQLSQTLAEDPDAPALRQRVNSTFAAYNFIYPFTYMLIHSLIGAMLFIWGKGTSWVARIRLYFGVISIGIALAVASVTVMPFVSLDYFWLYTVVLFIINILAYAITYARGVHGQFSMMSMAIRAPSIAVVVSIADFIVATIAGIGASMWAEIQLS